MIDSENNNKLRPRPWNANKTGLARSGVPEYEIHWSPYGECVAEVVHGEPAALLMSASPELFEAARDWVAYMVNNGMTENNTSYTKAVAAIAKAVTP